MIYLFICKDCNYRFTKEMSLTQYTATSIYFCPKCMSINTRRTYHDIPIIFNGEGFTKTVKEKE